MELTLGLLRRLGVLAENHTSIHHQYIAVCPMNCSLRYCMLGQKATGHDLRYEENLLAYYLQINILVIQPFVAI